MTMKASGTVVPAWEKRWRDYCRTLGTIESLEGAIRIARASAAQQLDEVRVLVEDEMRGPVPTLWGESQSSARKLVPRHPPDSPDPLRPGRL